MDIIKRQSLKRIAGVTVAGSGFFLVKNTYAKNQHKLEINDSEPSLSRLQVHTRVSSARNDIEVVITNTGENSARITQMTPSQTSTARGTFNFSQLMDHGDLVLEAGQSVAVPMTQHPALSGKSINIIKHAPSLTNSLRASFSVITDNAAFARIDVVDNIKLT